MIGKNISYDDNIVVLLFEDTKLLVGNELFDISENPLPQYISNICVRCVYHEYLSKIIPYGLVDNEPSNNPFFLDKLVSIVAELRKDLKFIKRIGMVISFTKPNIQLLWSGNIMTFPNNGNEFTSADLSFEKSQMNLDLIRKRASEILDCDVNDVYQITIKYYDPYIKISYRTKRGKRELWKPFGYKTITYQDFFNQDLTENFFIK